jgi:hypothetical protein
MNGLTGGRLFLGPVVLALVVSVTIATAQTRPLYLFGGDGHKEFLGCLNCDSYHTKSVWNEMSTFGFRNDFGIWNPFGQFANPFSGHSMCNEFAFDPPVIVDDNGTSYGRMSINEFTPGSVCGIAGNNGLCRAVRAICQSKS